MANGHFPIGAFGNRSGRVAYHYGMEANPEQGIGWSEIQDGDWVWPDSPAALVNMNDESGYRLALGQCSTDGLFYILNTRDGPEGSNLYQRFKDKQDPNNAGSGTEIPVTIKFPERMGSNQHYTISHIETHVHLRPMNDDNRGATGYTSTGQRSAQQFTLKMYKDGNDSGEPEAKQIQCPESRELMFTRSHRGKVTGNTLQLEIVAATSEFKIGRVESYFKIYDRARFPSANSQDNTQTSTEHDFQWSRDIFWVTRGAKPMRDRATQETVGTLNNQVTGPDSKSDSAATAIV